MQVSSNMAPSRVSPALGYLPWAVNERRWSRPVNFVVRASLTRVVTSLIIVLLLAVSAAEAGHHHEEVEARHECAICAVGSLTPLIVAHYSAPFACPTAACALPPGPQGPPLCAPYRNCLPSRAPPVPA